MRPLELCRLESVEDAFVPLCGRGMALHNDGAVSVDNQRDGDEGTFSSIHGA